MEEQLKAFTDLIGSLAEMAHIFDRAMITSGADTTEAVVGMTAFVNAWWHDTMENARRSRPPSDAE